MRTWCCACVVAAWWGVAAAGYCNVTIGDRNYTAETLVSDAYLSRGLAIDFNTYYLYFSFYNETTRMYSCAKVDIRSKALSVIEELRGPCIFTVDQARGRVHAGCSTKHLGTGGLHTWNADTGRFELAGEAERDIPFVHHHNDTLYYLSYPDFLLHAFTRGHSARVSALRSLVWQFVLDPQGDLIFTNSTGVYRRRGTGEEVQYAGYNEGVLAIAMDGRGAAYTCGIATAYGVRRLNDRGPATTLLDVDCISLTFDADGNIIYADDSRNSVVRLVPC